LFVGGCASNRAFPQAAFPSVYYQGNTAAARPNVTANIYFQATRNMSNLITSETSQYARALTAVLDAPAANWGTLNYNFQAFRFDVQNQELIAARGEFAYPLTCGRDNTPNQIHGEQGDVHIYGVFEAGFYTFDWYLVQQNRAPGSFGAVREQLQYYPHPYISPVVAEISALRNGEREISVIMTNLIGNPNEIDTIERSISEYLVLNPTKAVSTLAFYNNGDSFYILILGAITETAEFSAWLRDNLADMQPAFGFYTMGSVVESISNNHNAAVTQEFQGSRLAFNRDIHRNEREMFRQIGTPLYYTVWNRLISDNTARFSIDLQLDLLELPSDMVDLTHGVTLSFLDDDTMWPIPGASEYIQVSYLGDGNISLDVHLDMSVFEHRVSPPVQAVLVVSMYASLMPQATPQHDNELLSRVQTQFITDIVGVRGAQDRYFKAAEIYIHLIYR